MTLEAAGWATFELDLSDVRQIIRSERYEESIKQPWAIPESIVNLSLELSLNLSAMNGK